MKIFLFTLTLLLIYVAIEYLKTSNLIRIGEALARTAVPFSRDLNLSDERILVIGDSTAVGTGASSPETSLAGLLGKRYPNAAIDNLGVNGAKIADVKEQFKTLKGKRYSLIEIHIGGNDIVRHTDLADVEEDLREVLVMANTLSDQVILVSCGNVGTSVLFPYPSRWAFTKRTREVREIFIKLSQELAVDYVDLFHEAAEDPFAKDPNKYYAEDLFHPSDEGYQFWFDQIQIFYPPKLS